MSPDYIAELNAAKNERLLNLSKVVQQLIIDAHKGASATPDPVWQAFEPIGKLSIAPLPAELSGLLSINRHRKELSPPERCCSELARPARHCSNKAA